MTVKTTPMRMWFGEGQMAAFLWPLLALTLGNTERASFGFKTMFARQKPLNFQPRKERGHSRAPIDN